jgi:hypothetical protein
MRTTISFESSLPVPPKGDGGRGEAAPTAGGSSKSSKGFASFMADETGKAPATAEVPAKSTPLPAEATPEDAPCAWAPAMLHLAASKATPKAPRVADRQAEAKGLPARPPELPPQPLQITTPWVPFDALRALPDSQEDVQEPAVPTPSGTTSSSASGPATSSAAYGAATSASTTQAEITDSTGRAANTGSTDHESAASAGGRAPAETPAAPPGPSAEPPADAFDSGHTAPSPPAERAEHTSAKEEYTPSAVAPTPMASVSRSELVQAPPRAEAGPAESVSKRPVGSLERPSPPPVPNASAGAPRPEGDARPSPAADGASAPTRPRQGSASVPPQAAAPVDPTSTAAMLPALGMSSTVKDMAPVKSPASEQPSRDDLDAAVSPAASASNQAVLRQVARGEVDHPELGRVGVVAASRDGKVDVVVTSAQRELSR